MKGLSFLILIAVISITSIVIVDKTIGKEISLMNQRIETLKSAESTLINGIDRLVIENENLTEKEKERALNLLDSAEKGLIDSTKLMPKGNGIIYYDDSLGDLIDALDLKEKIERNFPDIKIDSVKKKEIDFLYPNPVDIIKFYDVIINKRFEYTIATFEYKHGELIVLANYKEKVGVTLWADPPFLSKINSDFNFSLLRSSYKESIKNKPIENSENFHIPLHMYSENFKKQLREATGRNDLF